MISNVALSIGIAGALLCVFVLVRDSRQLKVEAARRSVYRKYLAMSISGEVEPDAIRGLARAQVVVDEISREMAKHEFVRLISNVSGRLVFELQRPDRMSVMVKTVLDEKRLARARQSIFNEAFVLGHLGGLRAPLLLKAAVTNASRPFIVRQALPGVSLDRVLFQMATDMRPPTFSEVRGLLASVADAVADIHSAGVVHGDIKPANILAEWMAEGKDLMPVTKFSVYLLDFESAVVREEGLVANGGEIARGTPFFMAPERYAHFRLDATADVYSCSALAALLLTGRPERPGSQAGRRIPSAELRNVIRRGMSIDVGDRQSSIESWRLQLDDAFESMLQAVGDQPVSWPRDPIPLRQEIVQEAVSVTLGGVVRNLFTRVAGNLDLPTIDSAVRSQFLALDPVTQTLVERVWFEGVSTDEAGIELGLEVGTARRRVEKFLAELEEHVRELALDRERNRPTMTAAIEQP